LLHLRSALQLSQVVSSVAASVLLQQIALDGELTVIVERCIRRGEPSV
jgi:hypothetical protein